MQILKNGSFTLPKALYIKFGVMQIYFYLIDYIKNQDLLHGVIMCIVWYL